MENCLGFLLDFKTWSTYSRGPEELWSSHKKSILLNQIQTL